jgi:hypothetical protein
MAANIVTTISNQLLDSLVGNASYTVTTPIKLRLMTVNGTNTSAGTEVTGGSYASQNITFSSAGSILTETLQNNAAISFASMPATTVTGIELWDSSGTPKRLAWGPLTTNRTTASGDTLQFAINSIVVSLV